MVAPSGNRTRTSWSNESYSTLIILKTLRWWNKKTGNVVTIAVDKFYFFFLYLFIFKVSLWSRLSLDTAETSWETPKLLITVSAVFNWQFLQTIVWKLSENWKYQIKIRISVPLHSATWKPLLYGSFLVK